MFVEVTQYSCELKFEESKLLYIIAPHACGFGGQLFGAFAWADRLPGRSLGLVTTVVWKGEAETEHQYLHKVSLQSHLHVVSMAQQSLLKDINGPMYLQQVENDDRKREAIKHKETVSNVCTDQGTLPLGRKQRELW